MLSMFLVNDVLLLLNQLLIHTSGRYRSTMWSHVCGHQRSSMFNLVSCQMPHYYVHQLGVNAACLLFADEHLMHVYCGNDADENAEGEPEQ